MPSLLYDRSADGSVRARLEIGGKLRDLGRHPNDEEALAAVERAKRQHRLPKDPVTVARWDECWMNLYPGRRNERTAAHHRSMCRPFVREHGAKRLSDISILLAQSWAVGHPSQLRFLRQMFATACRAGLLDLNPWDRVEIHIRSEPRMPPTREELDRLVAAARARGGWWLHFADCILFTAYSGLRREEVERVQATDVLEAGRRVVVRGKRGAGEVDPRARVVALFGIGREALERQLPHVGRVWHAQQGGPLSQDAVDKNFGVLRRECDVKATWHGLRHYVAAWLLDAGASKQDVAIQLGHRDAAGRVDTTMVERIYGHMAVEPALERLESVVSEGGSDGNADAGGGPGADVAPAHGGAGQCEPGAQLPSSAQA